MKCKYCGKEGKKYERIGIVCDICLGIRHQKQAQDNMMRFMGKALSKNFKEGEDK